MIDTVKHSATQPKPILTDSMMTLIRVGDTVYFNRSGAVQIGTITKVVKNTWDDVRLGSEGKKWWSLKFEVEITCVDGKVSSIKNPNSFLIRRH